MVSTFQLTRSIELLPDAPETQRTLRGYPANHSGEFSGLENSIPWNNSPEFPPFVLIGTDGLRSPSHKFLCVRCVSVVRIPVSSSLHTYEKAPERQPWPALRG